MGLLVSLPRVTFVGRPPYARLLKCSHTEQLSWECSTHWNAPIIVMLVACHEMFLLHALHIFLRMYVNFIIFHINSCFFKSIILFSLNVPDGIHNDALPGLRSLFSHGHGQPDARAAIVIKFCSKASLLQREEKMLQSTKLVISYLGVLTNRKNYWIIWENFQQSQVCSFFAALCERV